MDPHSSLRASDADREAVAERLRHAAGEGRLDADELEARLHSALRARTYGDLKRLLADLPPKPMAWEHGRPEARPAGRTALAVAARVLVTLAIVAAVLGVAAVMTAWWLLWVVLWFGVCGRRSSMTRHRGRPSWSGSSGWWDRALWVDAAEVRAFKRRPTRCSPRTRASRW